MMRSTTTTRSTRRLTAVLLLSTLVVGARAFAVTTPPQMTKRSVRVYLTEEEKKKRDDEDEARKQTMLRRGLEEQPAYENPGRMELSELELARQSRDLDALEARWERISELVDWEQSKLTGFSEQAEIINGRAAMFFIVVGLLTEYWTGQSIPQQVLTLLRVTGVVGL